MSHYQHFNIPDSWEWTTLDDISNHISAGGDKPSVFAKIKTDNCHIPVYSNGTENDGLYGYTNNASIFDKAITISARGTIGFCCKRTNPYLPIVRLLSVVPSSLIDIDYLLIVLSSFTTIKEGSSIPQLTVPSISQLVIPIPPLNEQKIIAAKVNNLLMIIRQVDFFSEELQTTVSIAKSKIIELAMQGKLVPQHPADEPAADMLRRINPKARIITDNPHYPKWLCTYLVDICGFERGITFPSEAKRYDKIPGYIACLRTANVHDEVDLSSLWYISEEYLKGNDAKKLKAGDILMSTANSKELVGRSVIIRNLPESATFGGFVTVLRTQILLPEFFILFLKYKTLKGDFSKIATQTTNIANLNTKILSTVITPIPPRVEQSRIIQRVNQLFSVIDEIEASLQS